MYVQVMRGRVRNRDGFMRHHARWQQDLEPGAPGFLGRTAGVTDDGKFIMVLRFATQADAEHNRTRPEQSAWWDAMQESVDDVECFECPHVDTMLGGPTEGAGFVQVMVEQCDAQPPQLDPAQLLEVEQLMHAHRPDLIGNMTAATDDGVAFEVNYFVSEAAARANEGTPVPDALASMAEQWMQGVEIVEYLDLRDPLLA